MYRSGIVATGRTIWRPLEFWRGLELDRQFGLLAVVLATTSTVAIGMWAALKIEQSILWRSSGVAAMYVADLLAPLLQDLDTTGEISDLDFDGLDAMLLTSSMRKRVVAVKIWNRDGVVLYSTNRAAIGSRFPPEDSLVRAFRGEIISEVGEASAESADEFRGNANLFEVYAPIHDKQTGEVTAVAEFYEDSVGLQETVAAAQFDTWVITCLVLACNSMAFFVIVRGGSQTIRRQGADLSRRIEEAWLAAEREAVLRDRIEQGAKKAIEENERFLQALGADLHDGPAQLIALALLHLDRQGASYRQGATPDDGTLDRVQSALTAAMRDLREIIAGMYLSDVGLQPLTQGIDLTVRNHEARTGTRVKVRCANLPTDMASPLKVCICRFIQEGLSNSFRHAGGVGQSVLVEGGAGFVRTTVSDEGPGMATIATPDKGPHFGLDSLRRRLESLKGTLTVSNLSHHGTRLVACLPLDPEIADAS